VRCDLPRMKLVKSAGLQDRGGNRGVRRVLERGFVWRGETSGDETASSADEAASSANR
jgi:hypothetical protein